MVQLAHNNGIQNCIIIQSWIGENKPNAKVPKSAIERTTKCQSRHEEYPITTGIGSKECEPTHPAPLLL